VTVEWERRGVAAWVTFNRPEAHNAMTFEMYEQLFSYCVRADSDDDVRVLVLRGAGGRAFVAGTDIRQFLDFGSPEDGLEYERTIDRIVGRLESVRKPTIALVDGFAMGSGLALSAACDLRVCTRRRASGCRSRALSATACRWRTTPGWRRCSARRA
jgi:enoyl-CoA hydratase/carnithine racemase